MSKELVISANRHETRVAMVEDDQVVEVYHQRENEYSLAGSIHKGRVTRVLPGMQSAFVDIGLGRDAFLYVSDFFEDNEEYDKIVTSVEEKVLKLDRTPAAQPEAVAAEPAVVEATPAAAAEEQASPAPVREQAAVAPAGERVPGDSQREHRRENDDRRGRRSRRRRGQKPGRGLPESKFYSPGAAPAPEDEPEETQAPVAAPRAPDPRAPEGSDFFVLPGESLAKYRGPSSGTGEGEQAECPETEEAGSEAAAEEAWVSDSILAQDASTETARTGDVEPEPPEEPQSELAVAAEIVAETAVAEAEPEPEAEAAAPETVEPTAESEEPETAEDVDLAPADAAEPETEQITEPEAEQAEAETPAEAEAGEAVEAAVAEGVAAETVAGSGEEGPEPARVPTSLTAALREQGGRYPHRVSRRMRRKSRGERPPADPAQAPEAAPADQKVVTDQRQNLRPVEARPEKGPSIADLLKEGQEIIVQIAKEPLGQKGARITSHIALPGRFLVYMPTVDHIGVSRKIPSDDERMRLKRILQANRTGIPGGYIVRTAGDGRSEEELRADMMFLYNMWLDMRQKAERRPAPLLIHHDLNVVERVLRDQLTSSFKSIWVDNEETYESVLRFVQRFQPALVSRVKMYTRSVPIFDEFGITSELEKALRPKVWLKSGGYIVINQTEALVAIDVNTGKFVGKSNRLEDTIVKTNTDAIKEIVRQIRLRDLGGIIVVDFIDMDERKNRQKVMQALEEAMRSDRAPYKILQFNDFGLVAITRKRVKQSLERTLCTPCPYCEGAGYVKSPQTIMGEILQEAHKIARAVEGKDVMLRVAPEVAKLLKSNQNTYLQEMEEILGRTVIVKSDPQLHQERFDLA
jgi:ribonuclease G